MRKGTIFVAVTCLCVVLAMPASSQTLPSWADFDQVSFEQQGESLQVAIKFKGPVADKGLLHAGATFFCDYDDNATTGQSGGGRNGSETNLTFAEWDADGQWCMRVYALWKGTFGFVYRALVPITVINDSTLSFKHSLVGLGVEDISYDVNGYWLSGSNWWSDPYNIGDQLDAIALYSFNPGLVTQLDTLKGTKSEIQIPPSYSATATSENITGALDEFVSIVESEVGAISPTRPYVVTYNSFSDYPVFVYVNAPNNQFTTYIPGNQWAGSPNWWAMLEGAVHMTVMERNAAYREIFGTTMATDIPLPETVDGWYSTRYDTSHGLMWTTNHKPTFKAIIGTAFHNLLTIYLGEQLTHTAAKDAAIAARTTAANAYAAFSGNATDLDPWIMTGFLLDKLGSDLQWVANMWATLPLAFVLPTDTTAGDVFGELVKPYLRDGVADGSLPYATRQYWYQNIASIQAGAIDAVAGGDIYTQLKAISGYPTVDSVYNEAKGAFEGMLVSVENGSPAVPLEFNVMQNYPNPFNPTTKIEFVLPEKGLAKVAVYDILGREVKVLLNAELAPGQYEVNWDASQMPSGVYVYRVEAGRYVGVRKAVLLK
ncbi:MAG TPA: T9SS type A sorting domain-containing protein [Bacteroidota bacterium]